MNAAPRLAESSAAAEPRAPGLGLMLLEARAPWELASLLAAAPWLARGLKGDGHPVLVFPGLAANDGSTRALRIFLQLRGWSAYAWQQGFNFGPRAGVLDRCSEQLLQIAQRHGEPVSLVGWSLGGVYARELAKLHPAQVRCVVTLGTPFSAHPRSTNAWRLYRLLSGGATPDPAMLAQLREPPPVPTTSIYSRSDGVVAWRCSLNPRRARTENIEVFASHLGMGVNPLALHVLADRLRQEPANWRRFHAPRSRRWLFAGMRAPEHGAG
jgi:pimeloyl-ACP methyl ester carboxylesterase